jgi:hypothetical protein
MTFKRGYIGHRGYKRKRGYSAGSTDAGDLAAIKDRIQTQIAMADEAIAELEMAHAKDPGEWGISHMLGTMRSHRTELDGVSASLSREGKPHLV